MQIPAAVDTTKISAYHFTNRENAKLFELICDLYRKGDGIDRIILGVECAAAGIRLSVDDILDLFDEVPNPGNIGYYERQIIDANDRKELGSVVKLLQDNFDNPAFDVRSLVDNATNRLATIGAGSVNHLITAEKAVEQVYADTFGDQAEDDFVSISTGFRKLDDECGELMPGEMIVIAARPGCGKTSFALQVAEHVAEQQKHVLVTSLEMDSSELVKRSLAASTGIQSRNIRPDMNSDDAERIKRAMPKVASSAITFFVPPRTTMEKIRAAAKITKARSGLSLMVVDYIGLINGRGNQETRERVSEHSREMKALARELKIPILVLCQLNRSAEGVAPTMAHLRDSGAIEQDADRIIFLFPEDWEKKHRDKINMVVAKHRNGPKEKQVLNFDGERTRFMPAKTFGEFSNFQEHQG